MRRLVQHPLSHAFLLVAWFYVWTSVSDNVSWHFGERQTDYYNLLIHGFLKGHLSLDVEVPTELLRASDPYDPALRPKGVALHDASLFGDKYYIYFGVVPAALVMLPFRAVTGTDLPISAAVLGFALLAAGFLLLLLGEIQRRFFPAIGRTALAGLGVTVGVVSCLAFLLRRASMYELPIVSGAAFALAALWCTARAIGGSARKVGWVIAVSACWGLAIGSRPIYLLAPLSLVLAWPLLIEREPAGAWRRLLAAAILPIGAIGLVLASYNYARFGDPREFGLRYILSGVYEAKIEHFRLRYLPWNLHAYLCTTGEWGRYFPFFHGAPITTPRPRQHYGMDSPFGLLVNLPFLWGAAIAGFRLVSTAGARDHRAWRAIIGSLVWTGLAVTAFLFCFYAAMVRYLADFAPVLSLLAAAGGMAALAWVNGRIRAWLTGILSLAAVFSIFTGFMFTATLNARLRDYNPTGYAALARAADAPVHWLGGSQPDNFGPLKLRVMLPRDAAGGKREVLVVTGWNDERDRVWIVYPTAEDVEFGLEHAGAPMVRSVRLRFDRSMAHEITVSLGSLFPASTFPPFHHWTEGERVALLQRGTIAVDGRSVLDIHQRFYDATPGTVRIGSDGTSDAVFSGDILAIARESNFALWKTAAKTEEALSANPIHPDARGALRFRVRFENRGAGDRDPLVVSGQTGRGDFLLAEHLGDGRLRLILDHWGRRPYLAEPILFEPGREYLVTVSHPLYAPGSYGHVRAGEGKLVVTFNGRIVWECEPLIYPMEPQDIYIGRNPIGGTSVPEKFSGEIVPWSGGVP